MFHQIDIKETILFATWDFDYTDLFHLVHIIEK